MESRLQTIDGLRTSAYVADQINPPHAVVGVPEVENYHATFNRGRMALELQVWILVSATLDRTGQMLLADYANPNGPTSIARAIEGDKTLGGVANDTLVLSFRPLGTEEVGQLGYYGGVFDVRIIADGS